MKNMLENNEEYYKKLLFYDLSNVTYISNHFLNYCKRRIFVPMEFYSIGKKYFFIYPSHINNPSHI